MTDTTVTLHLRRPSLCTANRTVIPTAPSLRFLQLFSFASNRRNWHVAIFWFFSALILCFYVLFLDEGWAGLWRHHQTALWAYSPPACSHCNTPHVSVGVFITLLLLNVVGGGRWHCEPHVFGTGGLGHVFYLICLSHVWLLLMFSKCCEWMNEASRSDLQRSCEATTVKTKLIVSMRSFLPLLFHAIEQHGKNVLKTNKNTLYLYIFIFWCNIENVLFNGAENWPITVFSRFYFPRFKRERKSDYLCLQVIMWWVTLFSSGSQTHEYIYKYIYMNKT